MTKHFRFIIELRTEINDSPRGVVEHPETLERVHRLALGIATDNQKLKEVLGLSILDLLVGDHYTDTLRTKMKLKKEKQIILSAADELEAGDSEFFTEVFSDSPKATLLETQDNVVNLFFSQFGNPVILDVRLEDADDNMVSDREDVVNL